MTRPAVRIPATGGVHAKRHLHNGAGICHSVVKRLLQKEVTWPKPQKPKHTAKFCIDDLIKDYRALLKQIAHPLVPKPRIQPPIRKLHPDAHYGRVAGQGYWLDTYTPMNLKSGIVHGAWNSC